MRKLEALDLMKLHALGNSTAWNAVLKDCHKKQDINRLAKLRYQLQAGMDDLVKKKLNTEDMIKWFCRLNRSLELTAKKIIRERYPLPVDNPLTAKNYYNEYVEQKRNRTNELMSFLKKSAY